MNAFNVRERNNAKTCQTFKQLSKLSLFVCSLRHGVKYKYKKEKILQTENKKNFKQMSKWSLFVDLLRLGEK